MGFFRSPFYIDKMPIFCYIVLFIACCGDQVLPLSFEGTNLRQEDHTMAKDTLKLVGTDRAVTDINIVRQRKEEARMLSEKNVRAVYNRSNQAQQRLAKLIEQNHGDPATVFAKLSPEQMESLRRCAELAKEANPEMNKDIIRMMRQVTKISASFERRTKRLEQGLAALLCGPGLDLPKAGHEIALLDVRELLADLSEDARVRRLEGRGRARDALRRLVLRVDVRDHPRLVPRVEGQIDHGLGGLRRVRRAPRRLAPVGARAFARLAREPLDRSPHLLLRDPRHPTGRVPGGAPEPLGPRRSDSRPARCGPVTRPA